jgi:hypothetical protein
VCIVRVLHEFEDYPVAILAADHLADVAKALVGEKAGLCGVDGVSQLGNESVIQLLIWRFAGIVFRRAGHVRHELQV